MKKYLIKMLALTLPVLCLSSCMNSELIKGNGKIIKKEINVGEFSKIKAGGYYNIIISQGQPTKIVVETDENLMDYISTENNHGSLIIGNKRNIVSSRGTNIYVIIGKLDQIKLSGLINLVSADKLNLDKINLDLSGSCNVNMSINCTELVGEFEGNTKVDLAGTAFNATMEVAGASVINASEFITDEQTLDVSGTSLAKVNVVSKFNVKASGDAKVEYQGSPEMKKELSGNGLVLNI